MSEQMATADVFRDALLDLQSAEDELEEARAASSNARSRETEALNKVNQIQRNVDEMYRQRCSQSPRGTDWKQPR